MFAQSAREPPLFLECCTNRYAKKKDIHIPRPGSILRYESFFQTRIIMLKFYKQTSDAFTDRIERKLRDMVIAHKLIQVGETESLPGEWTKDDLPLLSNSHKTWSSPKEIEGFLEALHQEIKLGRSLQSDSCHIDPENPGQCL